VFVLETVIIPEQQPKGLSLTIPTETTTMTYLLTVTHKGTSYTKEFGLLSVASATLNKIEALSFAMSNYDVFFLIENISEETKDLLQYCDSLGFLTLNGNTYRCSDITTEAAYDQITSPD